MKLSLLFLLLACGFAAAAAPFQIVLPEKPDAPEKTAETELASYLKRLAAKGLTVGGESQVVFHIGDTALARSKSLEPARLQDEEWVVKSFGRDVVISGGGSRGTLYGVYHFLEEVCGVRWWNPDEEYLPASDSLTLGALDLRGKPAFIYRNIYRWPLHPDQGRFAARNRINHDGPYPITTQYGGAFYYGPPKHVHTFDEYIPLDKYMKDHPEYFALVDGVRKGGNYQGQLCLSNPAVHNVFLEQLRKNIKNGRRTAIFNETALPRLFDISQNDDGKPCGCPSCLKAIEQYGYSGQILNFVNGLAREIRKTNPEVMLTTLAYGYSLPPPKNGVRADDNVIVKVCRNATNAGVSIHAPGNKAFADTLRAWKKHAKNIFVWDYAVSYWDGIKGLPFASELSYDDKHRFYRENNVTGVFWEHEFPHVADMYDLKVYLEAKLMENPDLDLAALTDDFMTKYYGGAAPHIRDYRKRLDRAMRENDGYIGGNSRLCTFGYLDDATMVDCHAIMDQAEASVKDSPQLLKRVRRARLGLDRFTCRKGAGRPLPYVGGTLPPSRLDFAAAEARVRSYFPDCWKSLPPSRDRDALQQEIELELRQYHPERVAKTAKTPEQFRDKRYFDFTADYFEDHSKGRSKLTACPDSETGFAVRIPADDRYNKLPWEMGFYNTRTQKGLNWQKFAQPAGRGFQWYPLGTVDNLRDSILLLNAEWSTQLHFLWDEVLDKRFDVWVSVKFEGGKFFPEDKADDAIWIDRVIFVEQQEGGK